MKYGKILLKVIFVVLIAGGLTLIGRSLYGLIRDWKRTRGA